MGSFSRDSSTHDATAVAFSPDGQVLYVAATYGGVLSMQTSNMVQMWYAEVLDDDLCGITVTPDGWSVRVGSRILKTCVQFGELISDVVLLSWES